MLSAMGALVRRPVIIVACLLLIIVAYVGLAAAFSAHQQRERDARFDAWQVRSEAVTDAKLPGLLRSFAAVAIAGDLQQTSGPATRIPGKFVASFEPWHTVQPPRVSATDVAQALRHGGFAGVTLAEQQDGWKVTAAAADGGVTVYFHPNGNGSSVSGFLAPEVPRCC